MILMVAALMLLPAMSRADDATVTVQYLVVTQNDGSVTKFALTDVPVVSFDGYSIVVTAAGEVLKFDLIGVTNYAFSEKDVTTGITNTTVDGSDVTKPSFKTGSAGFSGLKSSSTILVYTISGNPVTAVKADVEGSATVDLSQLPKGIYIIKTPGKSYKIVNK
jgi:hypothetical protein